MPMSWLYALTVCCKVVHRGFPEAPDMLAIANDCAGRIETYGGILIQSGRPEIPSRSVSFSSAMESKVASGYGFKTPGQCWQAA
jgi:hypothetical protein